jgi:ankyrin repeat protein
MEYFLDADKPHWTSWSRVQKADVSWESFSVWGEDAPFPLYFASLGGFYDLAELLVGKHPEHINSRGGDMLTPLVAALRGKHFRIAELLHRHGAKVDVLDDNERTPLRVACRAEDLDIVQWLLNHGANVNIQNGELWTPLHSAAGVGRLEILKILIEHNADIHMRTNLGKSPLHLAATFAENFQHDHVDLVQVLLECGADPNARDNYSSTPLHHSSWWQKGEDNLPRMGTVEGTRLLLKHGAIIDAEDDEGRTPLQLALEHGRDEVAKCLKEHGATR